MTKLRKKVVIADRKVKSTASATKHARHKLSQVQLEEQVASLEAHNARLEAHNVRLEAQLAAIETQVALLRSSQWSVGSGQCSAANSGQWAVGSGLRSDQGSVGSGQYSAANSTRTTAQQPLPTAHYPLPTVQQPLTTAQTTASVSEDDEDDTVGQLQNWLDSLDAEFVTMKTLVPQLGHAGLSVTQRLRLNGSGVRRLGFIKKVYEVSSDFPQFWPPFGEGRADLEEYAKEIDVLSNLLIWFRSASRVVQDMLLTAGDDAFRVAGAYYTFAGAGARRRDPEAVQVFQMLKQFWHKRRRNTDVPTRKKLRRDFNALENGTKDGSLYIENESDKVVKGKKTVIDNVVPKSHSEREMVEWEETE